MRNKYILFISQSIDGIERRRLLGGIKAEEDADGEAHAERQEDGTGGNDGFEIRKKPTSRTPHPASTPIIPPRRLRVMASMRNWSLMATGCAPTAMRMPISRVRSVTLTSMMFMMPMPPTTSDMPAIAPSSSVMICEMELTVSAISF